MKRRSRGEQMLAAAGLAAPVAVTKPIQHHSFGANDDDVKSPPAKRARAMVKGDSPARTSQLAGSGQDEPKQLADVAVKLPAELELLASMFDAIRTGRLMLKRRSEKVTYNSVRHVVENITKREFRVEHIAQIKYLRPQSFDWQYIRTPSASNPLQLELQLLLTFDRPTSLGADGGGGGSVGKYSGASELADFRALLEQFVKANPVESETGKLPPIPQATLPLRPAASGLGASRSGSLPLGGLPSPATSAGAAVGLSSGLLHAASCPPGMLPDGQVVAGTLSGLESPGGSSGMSGASPSITRSRSRMGPPPPGGVPHSLTPIPEGGTPAAHKAAAAPPQHQQRTLGGPSNDGSEQEGEVVLEEDQEVGLPRGGQPGALLEETQREGSVASAQRTGFGVGGAAAAAATPQSKGPRPAPLQTTPTSQQQGGDGTNPRLARLHSLLSPAAMQKILQAEAAQAAQTPEAKRRAEMRRAVQLLPHGHELVRLVFGLHGPTVKPLTQVAQLMCERSTQRQGLTSREAGNALVALARAAPEFLRIEDPRVMADGSARPRSVVISRAANINAVAAKLKALAADPDAAVASIFERGVTADAGARGKSPGRSVSGAQVGPGAVPGSPAAQLRPRALALSLEGEAAATAAAAGSSGGGGRAAASSGGWGSEGAAAGSAVIERGPGALLAAEAPPPTPSSRRRPPGLPLAPPSPMVPRCAQTPTRSAAMRSERLTAAPGGSILGALAAGHVPAPSGVVAVPAASEFLQKLCRTGGAAAGGKSSSPALKGGGGDSTASGAGGPALGVGGDLGRSEVQEGAGRTPGRTAGGGRTPGRTAVQEVMLSSIRRSSAKRSCRKLLDDELGVGQGGDDDAEPVPRRLEESLFG